MDKKTVAFYYAPLRPYVNKYARKLGRFLYDWLPDVLVIFGAVWIIITVMVKFYVSLGSIYLLKKLPM